MDIEGEGMVESMIVNQSKAGAINKAKVFVVIPCKNRLGCFVNRLTDTENLNPRLVKTLHEFDGRSVTDFGADQGIGLREDKIGC